MRKKPIGNSKVAKRKRKSEETHAVAHKVRMINSDQSKNKKYFKISKGSIIEENDKLMTIEDSMTCHICMRSYNERHFFYGKLCPECAKLNYEKRNQKCDFTGLVAVVTGCRIKIGYEICLYLLRNGCKVIGTTRFAKDAFTRYSKEPDFDSFKHLLTIYPLDLRDLNAINKFIKNLYETQSKLDILINNAAQTLRRNIQFYKHLMDTETKPFESFDTNEIYKVLPADQLECYGHRLPMKREY